MQNNIVFSMNEQEIALQEQNSILIDKYKTSYISQNKTPDDGQRVLS